MHVLKFIQKLGPGCFEKVYEEILYYELHKRNMLVERQLLMPISYEELVISDAYGVDLLVEKKLVMNKINRKISTCTFQTGNDLFETDEIKEWFAFKFQCRMDERRVS